ncbi:MAG: hypothetical protein ABWZ43_00910 [Solirubrobacterales bacterium]
MSRRTISLLAAISAAWTLAASPSGAALPTHAELRAKTDRFLEGRPAVSQRLGGSGGVRGGGGPGAVLPGSRVVSFYGAPQMNQTILGMRGPASAASALAQQAAPYEILGERPVIAEFDLVSVFATAGGGPDGLYRSRQYPEVIDIYLRRARAADARLMLDIQPGRATFADELEALADYVAEPDVDVAIDPEWNVGRRGIPGRSIGRVTAKEVNAVSRTLARTVRAYGLPPKLLVVHQFRRGSVRGRGEIRQRPGVQVLLNFDGIGSPEPKAAGYAALTTPRLFDGFSLFYSRDTPLMKPGAVLRLEPEPDFLLYQ